MTKFALLTIIAISNIVFAFLLIHKQNNIVGLLYEIQQLQTEQQQLLEMKKNLLVTMHQDQQLSKIQQFAEQDLHMKKMSIADIKTISLDKDAHGAL